MPDQPITLTQLHIYPVKSLRGVALTEAVLQRGRLPGDRMWLLVNDAGHFMHQRDYPQMARIGVSIVPGGIVLAAEGLPDLALQNPSPASQTVDAITHVRLWRRSAPTVHVGADADAWLTRALGVSAQLMAFVPDAPALNVPDYEMNSSLQDATPFHITSEDSLADLNSRMTTPLPMNRFRPNIVVRGAAPYAEDEWKTFAIGSVVFRWIRACTRCAITTTDQQTGVRAKEPLRTLAQYRRQGSHVVFGHYVVAENETGTLRIGAAVTVR